VGRSRARKGQGKGCESEKRLSKPAGVAKGPRRRRMIEPCGRARVRFATGTSCSRSQGRPRRTGVPSLGEDPVPFIEIRRIDGRDCARERCSLGDAPIRRGRAPVRDCASSLLASVSISRDRTRASPCDSIRAPPEKILTIERGRNARFVRCSVNPGGFLGTRNPDPRISRMSLDATFSA